MLNRRVPRQPRPTFATVLARSPRSPHRNPNAAASFRWRPPRSHRKSRLFVSSPIRGIAKLTWTPASRSQGSARIYATGLTISADAFATAILFDTPNRRDGFVHLRARGFTFATRRVGRAPRTVSMCRPRFWPLSMPGPTPFPRSIRPIRWRAQLREIRPGDHPARVAAAHARLALCVTCAATPRDDFPSFRSVVSVRRFASSRAASSRAATACGGPTRMQRRGLSPSIPWIISDLALRLCDAFGLTSKARCCRAHRRHS